MEHAILTILSPGFEEVEAVTAIDILRRARLHVTTAALDAIDVEGSHGIAIRAEHRLADIDTTQFDMLVLPGGMRGVENMLASSRLMELAANMASRGCRMAAVCAAPLIYDTLSLLDGRRFTCHPCIYDRMKSTGVENVPTVTDGLFTTGRSAGCAMPWAIEMVRATLGSVPESLLSGLCQP